MLYYYLRTEPRLVTIYIHTMEDQKFIEYTVKALVDNPNDVKVERRVDEMGVLITIDINPEDMGKVIGRQGNTAKALRTLLRVVGMKHNARVNLKINEPEGSKKSGFGDETPSAPVQNGARGLDDVLADLNKM